MDNHFRSIQVISAVSENNAIGRKSKLPWNFPADLAFSKKQTVHCAIVMGRTTFESIGKKPLPNRFNVVVSTTLKDSDFPGVQVVSSLEEALSATRDFPKTFVVGGTALYKEALEKCADTAWITRIPTTVPDADAFFPKIPKEFEVSSYFRLSLREDKSLEMREITGPENDVSAPGALIVQKYEHPDRVVKTRKAPVNLGE